MATSSMVPYSNPAGKNQTAPSSGVATASPTPFVPTPTPLNPTVAAQANPLVPVAATPGAITVPSGTLGANQNGISNPNQVLGNDTNLYQQWKDIYGDTGASLYNFMQGINGVESSTLQDYIKSLQPEFATSDANLRTSLGAGGVSANSSVTALGQANLQSKEDSLIADESAKLLQSQEGLQANILESTLPSAEKQVADSSGWNTFAQILSGIGGVASSVMGLGDVTGGLSKLFKGGSKDAASVPTSSFDFANEDDLLQGINQGGI